MTNEEKFWAYVAKLSAQPLDGEGRPDQANLYAYIVDASSGWRAQSAIQWQDMLNVRDEENMPDGAHLDEVAADMVVRAGHPQSSEPNQPALALTIAVAAMAMSSTFGAVNPGGITGHWLFIAYKLADNSHTGSVMFLRQPGQECLAPHVLQRLIAQTIEQDTTGAYTPVSQRIAQRGGAILATQFTPAIQPPSKDA